MIERRQMSFTIPGQIIYDPIRGKDKSGRPIVDTGRCTIRVPGRDLCKYYAKQFYHKYGIQLLDPSWEPHLTIIANRFYSRNKLRLWGYLDKKDVVVSYSHQMFWNEEHVWIAAEAPEVQMILEHYDHQRYDRGHITIGKFKDGDVGRLPNFKKFEDLNLWSNYANSPI